MLIFKKIKYEDIPKTLADRVLEWSDKEVKIDDVSITKADLKEIIDYLIQEGYKEI